VISTHEVYAFKASITCLEAIVANMIKHAAYNSVKQCMDKLKVRIVRSSTWINHKSYVADAIGITVGRRPRCSQRIPPRMKSTHERMQRIPTVESITSTTAFTTRTRHPTDGSPRDRAKSHRALHVASHEQYLVSARSVHHRQ